MNLDAGNDIHILSSQIKQHQRGQVFSTKGVKS
jgi:hypothetical protein